MSGGVRSAAPVPRPYPWVDIPRHSRASVVAAESTTCRPGVRPHACTTEEIPPRPALNPVRLQSRLTLLATRMNSPLNTRQAPDLPVADFRRDHGVFGHAPANPRSALASLVSFGHERPAQRSSPGPSRFLPDHLKFRRSRLYDGVSRNHAVCTEIELDEPERGRSANRTHSATPCRAGCRAIDAPAGTGALEQSPLADGHEVVRRTDFGDAPVTNASSSAEKIALFRDLFADREVVFSPRWETTAGCPVRLFGGERVSREIDKELHTWCHIV